MCPGGPRHGLVIILKHLYFSPLEPLLPRGAPQDRDPGLVVVLEGLHLSGLQRILALGFVWGLLRGQSLRTAAITDKRRRFFSAGQRL